MVAMFTSKSFEEDVVVIFTRGLEIGSRCHVGV